MLFVVIALM